MTIYLDFQTYVLVCVLKTSIYKQHLDGGKIIHAETLCTAFLPEGLTFSVSLWLSRVLSGSLRGEAELEPELP